MEYLWTPWRSTYMKAKNVRPDCVFCVAARDESEEEKTLVVYRGERCFIILNRYPYTTGHLMVVPYEHMSKLTDADEETAAELMRLVRRAEHALEDVYRPDGLNLGMNIGTAAGAGIAQHIHMHVLPRWSGDANFMTTIGNARIIPEALDETYRKMKAKLAGSEFSPAP
jgi:ATP adenylyltransferase